MDVGFVGAEHFGSDGTPSWVRARVMAIYLLVFTGSLAAGSALWGFIATRIGISNDLRYQRWA